MPALKVILWLGWLWISWRSVFVFVGAEDMTQMFPEGRRWWLLPSQIASLGMFAACVLCHPF
jgi:hypothetical protein